MLLTLAPELIDLILDEACVSSRYDGVLTPNLTAGRLLVVCRALYPQARQKLWQFVWLPSIHFARHRVSLDRVISSDIGICDAITVLHVDFLTSHIEAPEEADGGASDSEAAPREATLSLTLATVALLPRCRHLKALHISFDSQFDDRNESASLIFLAARSMPARLLCLDVRVHCMSQRTALELHGRFLEAVDAHRATLRDISYTVTAINGPDESSGNVPCMSLAPLVAAPQLQCLLLELPMPFPEVEDLPKQTLKHLTISSPELSWLKGFCSTVGRFVTCLTLDGIEFSDPTVHPIGPSVTQIDLPHLRHLKESFTKNNFLPPINDTLVLRSLVPFAATSVSKLTVIVRICGTISPAKRGLRLIFDSAIAPLGTRPNYYGSLTHLDFRVIRFGPETHPSDRLSASDDTHERIETFAADLRASGIKVDLWWRDTGYW